VRGQNFLARYELRNSGEGWGVLYPLLHTYASFFGYVCSLSLKGRGEKFKPVKDLTVLAVLSALTVLTVFVLKRRL